jgi:hypothetical protein
MGRFGDSGSSALACFRNLRASRTQAETFGTVALSFVLGWLTAVLCFLGYLFLHHYTLIASASDVMNILSGFAQSYALLHS